MECVSSFVWVRNTLGVLCIEVRVGRSTKLARAVSRRSVDGRFATEEPFESLSKLGTENGVDDGIER